MQGTIRAAFAAAGLHSKYTINGTMYQIAGQSNSDPYNDILSVFTGIQLWRAGNLKTDIQRTTIIVSMPPEYLLFLHNSGNRHYNGIGRPWSTWNECCFGSSMYIRIAIRD
ncbi:uncharacterized protein LOC127565823 [Drosophila albomicans]|uniref:Uncharacterized protein LOC127565823 n=1 Tax=Drosophila albomicans TaxID=7291 RepID=A0A9C6T9L5_DROAB|nr:uncharacterized protein LOC127565823 [Drosophila albomicans]